MNGNARDLLRLMAARGITDLHFREDAPPILRRRGRLAPAAGLAPLAAGRLRELALQLMDPGQRQALAGLPEASFASALEGGGRYRVRLWRQNGLLALTLREDPGSYHHPSLAKPPEKRQWVRLTRVCNDRCSFCLDKEAQNGTVCPVEEILRVLEAGRKKGLKRVVLSGGEPTVHPDYVEIVRRTKAMGYEHIQTVTNGRRMFYEQFMRDSVAAGLSEITFSLHGHTPQLHDSLTHSPGSFAQGLVALRRALTIPGLIVSVDIVINRRNVRHLRDTLDFFIKEGVREFDLLQVIPFGAAWYNQQEMFYDVEAELPHLHRALDLSKRGDVVIWTNRLKPQYLEGYEDLIQPPSKLHDEYRGRGTEFEEFLQKGKKPECWGRCPHCFLQDVCKDIHDLQAQGALTAKPPVPECLNDVPESMRGVSLEGLPVFAHAPDADIHRFVDFYVQHRYFVKGKACSGCRLNDTCAGAHVEHVRRYGFPKPKAGIRV